MKITFRRYDNTVSSLEPTETATVFDFGENTRLARAHFDQIKQTLKEQEAKHLVGIFAEESTFIHFTRSVGIGKMPNEDCYYNLI